MKGFAKLTIQGVKNHINTVLDLTRRVLLTGDNGAGKSGIIDGLVLAITGKVPHYGADFSALREVIADGGTVTLELDDLTVIRTFVHTPRKARVDTRAIIGGKVYEDDEADARIGAILGGANIFAFSFRKFLAANGPDRRRILLEMLPSQDPKEDLLWEQVGAITAVQNLWTPKGQKAHEPEHTKDVAASLGVWLNGNSDVPQGLKDALFKISAPDLLLTTLHEGSKDSQREARALTQAANAMVEISPEVRELAEKVPELEASEADLTQKLAAVRHAAEGAGVSERADLEATLTELRGALDGQGQGQDLDRLEERLREAKAALAHHEANMPILCDTGDLDRMSAKLEEIHTRRAAATEKAKQIRRDHLTAKTGICPVMDKRCAAPAELASYRTQTEKAYLEAVEEVGSLVAAAKEVAAEVNILKEQFKAFRAENQEWEETERALTREVSDCETALEVGTRKCVERKTMQARSEAIQRRLKDLPEKEAVDTDYETGLTDRLEIVQATLREARQAAASLDLSSRIDVDQGRFAAEVWKAAYSGAKDSHSAYINSLLEGVRYDFYQNLKALGFAGGEFTIGKASVGFKIHLGDEPPVTVGIDALSDGQAALCALALIGSIPRPEEGLHIFMLEAADVSATNLQTVLRHSADMSFDLVVAATHVSLPKSKVPNSWTVVPVEDLIGGPNA